MRKRKRKAKRERKQRRKRTRKKRIRREERMVEDNAWTPVLGSFFKLQEVGYFPTWFTFSLKAL